MFTAFVYFLCLNYKLKTDQTRASPKGGVCTLYTASVSKLCLNYSKLEPAEGGWWSVYTASANVSLISPYLAAHWMLDTSDVMRKKIGITKYSFGNFLKQLFADLSLNNLASLEDVLA